MFNVKNPDILRFVPDYKVNLIAPANIDDKEFDKFHTGFGIAMKAIKHQNDNAVEVFGEQGHQKIDRGTAEFLKQISKWELEFEEEGDDVDMWLAFEKKSQRDKVIGAIDVLKIEGATDEDIISKVMRIYDVSGEYVQHLLSDKATV